MKQKIFVIFLFLLSSTMATALIADPLAVNQGGTGVATLSGLAKGNGTSAFTAAAPGTDYVTPSQAATSSVLGLVKPDNTTISNSSGAISVNQAATYIWTGSHTFGSAPASIGAGQATSNYNTIGALGGSILLQDTGNSVNSGGAVLLGERYGYFAAIKGLTTNASSNTSGDIDFETRHAVTDSTLKSDFRISPGAVADYGTLAVTGAAAFNGGATAITPPTTDNSTDVATTAWVSTTGNVGGVSTSGGIDYLELDAFPGPTTNVSTGLLDDGPRLQMAYNTLCERSPAGGIIHLRAHQYYFGSSSVWFGSYTTASGSISEQGPPIGCAVQIIGENSSETAFAAGTWFNINSAYSSYGPFVVNAVNTSACSSAFPNTVAICPVAGFEFHGFGISQTQVIPPGGLNPTQIVAGNNAGAANAITLNASGWTGASGQVVLFTATTTNTGAATASINGGSAEQIVTSTGAALNANAIIVGSYYMLVPNGGNTQLVLYIVDGSSWTPTVYPPLFNLGVAGRVSITDINCASCYQLIKAVNTGRLTIGKIYGQVLYKFLYANVLGDAMHSDGPVHLFPTWSQNENVFIWQQQNMIGYDVGQAGGYFPDTFMFAAYAGINLREDNNSYLSRSAWGNIYLDFTKFGLIANSSTGTSLNSFPSDIHIANLFQTCLQKTGISSSQADSASIFVGSNGGLNVSIGNLSTAQCGGNNLNNNPSILSPIQLLSTTIASNIYIGSVNGEQNPGPLVYGLPGCISTLKFGSTPLLTDDALNVGTYNAELPNNFGIGCSVIIPQIPSKTLTGIASGSTIYATAQGSNPAQVDWAHKVYNISSSAALSSLTIQVPSTPIDGQTAQFQTQNTIAAVNFVSPDGYGIIGSPSSMPVGKLTTFTYSHPIGCWYAAQ